MPTGNIWWSKLQPDICQHDLIRVGLPLIVKGHTPRDMDTMKISPFGTGSPYWSGAGAGSSEPGFHVRGTVPKCKKCMGTLNPRCFLRHMDPAQPSNFCPNPWDTGLRVVCINHKVENTQYKKSTYLQSFFRLVVIIHTQSWLAESFRTETPWSAGVSNVGGCGVGYRHRISGVSPWQLSYLSDKLLCT